MKQEKTSSILYSFPPSFLILEYTNLILNSIGIEREKEKKRQSNEILYLRNLL